MNNEFAKNFKEIMNNYNIKRQEWIIKYGTEKGFDEWFTKQIIK